jgi:hypothetical protein
MGVMQIRDMQIRDMCSVYVSLGPTPLTPERHAKIQATPNGGCLVAFKCVQQTMWAAAPNTAGI